MKILPNWFRSLFRKDDRIEVNITNHTGFKLSVQETKLYQYEIGHVVNIELKQCDDDECTGNCIYKSEDFNTLIEYQPNIARFFAETLGLSIGQLRIRVINGEISENTYFSFLDELDRVIAEKFVVNNIKVDEILYPSEGRVEEIGDNE